TRNIPGLNLRLHGQSPRVRRNRVCPCNVFWQHCLWRTRSPRIPRHDPPRFLSCLLPNIISAPAETIHDEQNHRRDTGRRSADGQKKSVAPTPVSTSVWMAGSINGAGGQAVSGEGSG